MDCTFASDNTSGVHPKVMEALNKANVGAAEPYGDDPWTAEAEGCFKALFGEKLLPVYSIIVVAFILVGSTLKVDLVWALADLFNGLMAVPNLLALLALAGVVVAIDRK